MAERVLKLIILRLVMAVGGVGVVVGRGGAGRGSGGVGRGSGAVGRGSGGVGRSGRGEGGGPREGGRDTSPGTISFISIDGRRTSLDSRNI